MRDWIILKKKEKSRTKKNSKKEGEIIANRKIRNYLDFDANHKWLLEANQTNQNTKTYKSETHVIKGLIRFQSFIFTPFSFG